MWCVSGCVCIIEFTKVANVEYFFHNHNCPKLWKYQLSHVLHRTCTNPLFPCFSFLMHLVSGNFRTLVLAICCVSKSHLVVRLCFCCQLSQSSCHESRWKMHWMELWILFKLIETGYEYKSRINKILAQWIFTDVCDLNHLVWAIVHDVVKNKRITQQTFKSDEEEMKWWRRVCKDEKDTHTPEFRKRLWVSCCEAGGGVTLREEPKHSANICTASVAPWCCKCLTAIIFAKASHRLPGAI